jgi:hypothetical protein
MVTTIYMASKLLGFCCTDDHVEHTSASKGHATDTEVDKSLEGALFNACKRFCIDA